MLFLFGCQDYGLSHSDKAPAEAGDTAAAAPDTGAADAALAELSFSAAWELQNWGGGPPSCVFSLAFHAPGDTASSTPGQVVEYPEEPGTCVYTAFAPEDTPGSAPRSVAGSVDAGAVVLRDSIGDLALVRTADEDGYSYALTDCDAASWPFGRLLGVFADAPPDGLPALGEDALLPIAPWTEGAQPDAPLEGGFLLLETGSDLRLDWSSGAVPAAGEERTLLVLRHFRGSEATLFEALACMPDEAGTITVPADVLASFSPDTEGGETWIAAQVDTSWFATEAATGWGDVRRASSMSTWGGRMLRLEP